MDFSELKDLIGPDDVRAVLDSQIYETFAVASTGRDPVGAALTTAAAWAWAVLNRCRADQVPELDVLRAALVKRAVYELYTGGENEASAEDKKADAEALMIGLFGDCAKLSAEKHTIVGGAVTADGRLAELYPTTD